MFFFKIIRVCDSRAGRAERKNEIKGRKYHWIIIRGSEAIEVSTFIFFLILISIYTYTRIIEDETVRINPDNWGRRKPRTVFLNAGLIRAGMEALMVSMKKEIGQSR